MPQWGTKLKEGKWDTEAKEEQWGNEAKEGQCGTEAKQGQWAPKRKRGSAAGTPMRAVRHQKWPSMISNKIVFKKQNKLFLPVY